MSVKQLFPPPTWRLCDQLGLSVTMPSIVGKGAVSVAFVRPSVCLSVHPSVAYTVNNSRIQRLSVPKFGMKVPHLTRDSHTSFKVKRSKIRVTDGRGHTMWAEPGGDTACSFC